MKVLMFFIKRSLISTKWGFFFTRIYEKITAETSLMTLLITK